MKQALTMVVVLGVILLGWRLYLKLTQPKGPGFHQSEASVPVEVAPVQKATIREVAQFTGTLFPHSQFIVAPKVPGRLEKLFVNIGDPVQKDQPIAVLDSQEYAQQAEAARAELEVAKASVAESNSSLDAAKRELDRITSLRQKGVASESELDAADANFKAWDAKYNVSVAQVAQKEAGLKAAQIRLSYTQIQASWEDDDAARVVGERFVDEGAMLRANDPIVSMLDVDPLTAVVYVIERDYPKLRIGEAAITTTDAYPQREFAGTVLRIAPLLQEESRQARVELNIPNPDRLLKPGMFVRVQTELARHDNAAVIPVSAVTKRNEQQGVFLADAKEMKAHFLPVTLGIVSGDLAEVLEPSLDGMVVTVGHHLLDDGSAIALPGAATPSPEAKGGQTGGEP